VKKTRRAPLPHARIHLPPLSADYALTLVAILERAIRAVWRAHGDRMAELLALREDERERDRARRSNPFRDDGNPDADQDLPF
jgi:hypothetical protein